MCCSALCFVKLLSYSSSGAEVYHESEEPERQREMEGKEMVTHTNRPSIFLSHFTSSSVHKPSLSRSPSVSLSLSVSLRRGEGRAGLPDPEATAHFHVPDDAPSATTSLQTALNRLTTRCTRGHSREQVSTDQSTVLSVGHSELRTSVERPLERFKTRCPQSSLKGVRGAKGGGGMFSRFSAGCWHESGTR